MTSHAATLDPRTTLARPDLAEQALEGLVRAGAYRAVRAMHGIKPVADIRAEAGPDSARIDQPALLLWCRQDAVIDASALDLYAARVPQAQKVLLDDCGHMSIIEKPDSVAAAVVALIERGNPR